MTYTPPLPSTGYAGWRFLSTSGARQQEVFEITGSVALEKKYFEQNISKVKSADDLVSNHRLLKVALTAFGLESDSANKAFIKKILTANPNDSKSFVNRMSDKRYLALNKAFSFASTPKTSESGFAESILSKFGRKSFEIAIGEQSSDLRLALSFKSSIEQLTTNTTSDKARWLSMLGETPLRNVLQTALGLSSAISKIDIDQQRTTFQTRAEKTLGIKSFGELTDSKVQEKVIRLFLIRSEASAVSTSAASMALQMLSS